MNEELLKSIDSKLTSIIKLLAIDAIKDKPKGEQAEFLHKIGLTSAQIGEMLNKSPTTIRVQLHQKKTGHKKGKSNEK
jgi:hypothetical protein